MSASGPGAPSQEAPDGSQRIVVWHPGAVERLTRARITGGVGMVVWLTGLSGSGKSTVAVEIERRLVSDGRAAYLLDGDNIRHGLNTDLGFSAADRDENVRRVGEVATLFADSGVVAVVPLVSPYRQARDAVRARVTGAGLPFIEVHVATSLEECERRDPKGLYARARAGELSGMTGIDDPYEAPLAAELVLTEADGDAGTQAGILLGLITVP